MVCIPSALVRAVSLSICLRSMQNVADLSCPSFAAQPQIGGRPHFEGGQQHLYFDQTHLRWVIDGDTNPSRSLAVANSDSRFPPHSGWNVYCGGAGFEPLEFSIVSYCGVGCTDVAAHNFDSSTRRDDGSCEYSCIEATLTGFCEYGSLNGKSLWTGTSSLLPVKGTSQFVQPWRRGLQSCRVTAPQVPLRK